MDGKNAYDSVCRIISKTSSTCEGASGVILYVCVGEEEREREKEKIIPGRERKKESIYLSIYIYQRSVVLILVSLV